MFITNCFKNSSFNLFQNFFYNNVFQTLFCTVTNLNLTPNGLS